MNLHHQSLINTQTFVNFDSNSKTVLNEYNQKLKKAMNKFFMSLLLMLLCTFCSVSSENWQAGGNITEYLPYIWTNIQNNIGTYVGTSTNLPGFAKNLSDTFNRRWDTAWNVVVVELLTDKTLDGVVMGYAFRDHWMWHNGYQFNGRTFSFIVWKDYNCKTWNKVGNTGFSSRVSAQTPLYNIVNPALTTVKSANSGINFYTDIWAGAQLLNKYLRKTYPNEAYTILIFQKGLSPTSSTIGANFCSVGSVESYVTISIGLSIGGMNMYRRYFAIKTMMPLS